MEMSQQDIALLKELEESLWIADTRFDKAYMEKVLSPDFFEYGCSGKTYEREVTIAVPFQEINATLPLKNFAIHPIANDVVQVTYISEVQYEELQVCNRSSIWVKSAAGWQLRFHQGTPLPKS